HHVIPLPHARASSGPRPHEPVTFNRQVSNAPGQQSPRNSHLSPESSGYAGVERWALVLARALAARLALPLLPDELNFRRLRLRLLLGATPAQPDSQPATA